MHLLYINKYHKLDKNALRKAYKSTGKYIHSVIEKHIRHATFRGSNNNSTEAA